MDALTLLTLFDQRWVFGYEAQQNALMLPFILNVIHIYFSYFNIQSSKQYIQGGEYFKGLIILMAIGQGVNYLSLNYSKSKVNKKTGDILQNRQNIVNYLYRLQIKRSVWSQFCFAIFGASILSTLVSIKNLIYPSVRPTIIHTIWTYFNTLALLYIVFFFLFFLLRKCTYLLRAWRFPLAYLKAQNIIK